MPELSLIDLLIVDRSATDVEGIVQTLQEAGYSVQALHSDQEAEIRDFLQYKPIDLIMVRQAENLPRIAEIRAHLTASALAIPVLAILDDPAQQSPLAVLKAGADNFCLFREPEHLIMTVRKELQHLRIRQESRSREVKLRESEERCRVLLENTPDAIAYIHEGAHTYANPAYLKLFGYADAAELESVTLMDLVVPDDRDKLKAFLRQSTKAGKSMGPMELTGLDKEGQRLPLSMECSLTHVDEEPCLQIWIRNAVQAEAPEQKPLDPLAERDGLTGLHNRKFFTQYLERMLAGNGSGSGAVLYILLTDYRTVSEHLGLEAVDQLVIDLAKLLQKLVSDQAIIARFSDAVFTIYTAESSSQAVLQLGERICEAVKAHVSNAGRKLISTTSSIGICMVQKSHENAMQILSQVDRVCEISRQMGGNQVQIYPPLVSKPNEPQQEEKVSTLIRDAMQGQRVGLLYQPIASFQGNVIERYKAYLRIVGEDKKPLPMSTFGPVAESRGMMGPLDRWVISRGLKNVSERYRKSGRLITLFVRVSQNSVTEEDFQDWLDKLFKDSGLKGDALVIEVAEPCAEKCLMETKRLREHLQRLGCGFALSHCTGKSNSERILNYLVPDYLKLDGSLFEKLAKGKDEDSRRAVAALTEQAQRKNALVVAADVATAPQMASIWQFGVTLVQGDMVQEASTGMDFDFQQFAG